MLAIALSFHEHLWCATTTAAERDNNAVPLWRCQYKFSEPITNFNGCDVTGATISKQCRNYILQQGAEGEPTNETDEGNSSFV